MLTFAATAAWSAKADPDLPGPENLVIYGEGKPAPGGLPPSLGYAWDGKAEKPRLLYSKRSPLVGDLHSFARAGDGREFYLNANRFAIVVAGKEGEQTFFTHTTYVRHICLDGADHVYFTEASGAGRDGKIYRVRPGKGGAAATAEEVCTVPLRDVGFWAGHFAFARDGNGKLDTDTLYLSSGNLLPASIYRMRRKGGKWEAPERVFAGKTSIMGLVFTDPRTAYFVSGNQVYRLTDLKKAEVVLTLPDVSRLRGIAMLPTTTPVKKDK
jgi:hypothetical protein